MFNFVNVIASEKTVGQYPTVRYTTDNTVTVVVTQCRTIHISGAIGHGFITVLTRIHNPMTPRTFLAVHTSVTDRYLSKG